MKKLYFIALSLVLIIFFNIFTLNSNLQNKTVLDLDTMYQLVMENHPGVYNLQDPDFVKNMDKGYQEAKESIVNIHNQEESFELLDKFAQSFKDQHLCVYVPTKEDTPSQVDQRDFLIRDFTDNIVWITIPNLDPSEEQQKQLESLIKRLPDLRAKKSIVFDLRSNGGGSTLWSNQILEALFGKEYVATKFSETYFDCYEDFRATKSNLEYWRKQASWFEQHFGKDSREYKEFEILINGMQEAYDNKKIFFSMQERNDQNLILSTDVNNLCSANIIIIINRGCFSSCISFIYDLQLMTKNTILLGQKTSVNTAYMEIREDILPSGIHFRFPTAIGRNSKPFFHYYVPNIEYPSHLTKDINDKQSREYWLEDIIRHLNF